MKRFCGRPLSIALGINLVVLAISLILGDGKYNSLDDYFMSAVLTGAYGGNYDVHLYFINVAYGYFLMPFYALFPKMGWYAIFESFSIFASFTAISFVIIRRCGHKLGFILTLLFTVSVSFEFYTHVAFTQCAGATTAAGILLFTVGSAEKKRSDLAFACLFMIAGIIFRKEMFLVGVPTLTALLLFSFVRNKKIWKGSLIVLALFALAYAGLGKINSLHYQSDGYDYYAAYQGPRAYFGDGAFYDANNFVAELDDRGLTSRDYRYLRAWYFYDNNVFSLDSIRNLMRIAERSRFEPNYLKIPFAVIKAISDNLMHGHTWCWALLCLALMFFSNQKNWYVPWASLFLICIPYTYLLLVNRVVGHVEVGIWVYTVVFLLFFVDKKDFYENKRLNSFLQITSLICVASLTISGTHIAFDKLSIENINANTKTNTNWDAFLTYAKDHPSDVFLLPFDHYKNLARHVGYTRSSIEPGYWNNIFSTGYWNIHLPAMERELKERGVNNIIKDVINDNVYMLSDMYQLSLIPYYSDHYHEKICADTLASFGNINLLKYRKGESENEKAQH